MVTFDILEPLAEFGFELEYDMSPTEPFNDGFDTLGYGSAEPIDLLGTLNFIFLFMVAKLLWLLIKLCFYCRFCPKRL